MVLNMVLPVRVPEWARSVANAGYLLAQLPSTPVGQLAPRLLLSVPTGQFVSWMLANGALKADPKLGRDPVIGDRVTTWLDKKMQDVEVCTRGDLEWEIRDGTSYKKGKIGIDRVPGVVLPEETPTDRGFGQPTPEYRDQLSVLGANYSQVYAEQWGSPVVVIGDGKEFLRSQRDELVNDAHDWLDRKSAVLLDQESGQVSNPNRILFHPFMILSPEVAQSNLWLRTISPRLVIITRWSYYRRMDPALFGSTPMVVIANRRVENNWNAIDETDEYQELREDFSSMNMGHFPNGVFVRKFVSRVEPPQEIDEELEI
jgi:hypothetical protein